MLHLITLFTAFAVIVTGVYVMVKGDWHKFGLKFAGVALSTTAAIWLFTMDFVSGGQVFHCSIGSPCLTYEIYHIIRNMAFLVFHIAIGRDAIEFKKFERRGTTWRKNTLDLSPH